jgi:hypothetical protein
MPEEINLAGVVETLQHENERLRLHILKMRTAHHPLEAINPDGIRAWIIKNYFIIVAVGFILMVALSFVDTARGLFNKNEE